MIDLEKALEYFSSSNILGMLDRRGRKRVIQCADKMTFSDKSVVVREGEIGNAFYIIIKGKALVLVDDMGAPKAVAELAEGTFFGEMAVITSQPRSATVTAKGELSLLRVSRDPLMDVLKDYPKIREYVAKMGVARTEDTMKKMMTDS